MVMKYKGIYNISREIILSRTEGGVGANGGQNTTAGAEAAGSVAGGLHLHRDGLGKSYLRRGRGGTLRGRHKGNGSNWAVAGSRAG